MKSARFVIGLGNPGKGYEKTRHNFGFEVLDEWARAEGKTWRKCKYGHALEAQMAGGQFLIKPQTFMNLSGEVVREVVRWWKCELGELLVVVDDVALPLGKMRLRAKGSAGGHNGLKSIEGAIGSREYPRLRLGIGKGPEEGIKSRFQDLADYVLDVFTQEEEGRVERLKKKAILVIKDCYTQGLEYGMMEAHQYL